jgi:hypothetical protein
MPRQQELRFSVAQMASEVTRPHIPGAESVCKPAWLMAARVVTQPNFHLEVLHPLFQSDLTNFTDPIFDVTPDGQRFVVLTADRAKTSSITLLTNWPAALKWEIVEDMRENGRVISTGLCVAMDCVL